MPPFTGIHSKQETQGEAFTNAADLFARGFLEKATERVRECTFRPINLDSQGPFDFHIPPEGDLYLNPANIRLDGKIKVVKIVNGIEKNLEVTDQVALVNFASYSFFRTVEVDFQGKLVSYVATPNQHYKSVIENLLSYNKSVQDTHLQTAIYYPDEAGKFEETDTNSGWMKRKELISKSKEVDFSIDLHSDILACDKFWPNGLDVTVRLTRATDSFSLIAKPQKPIPTETAAQKKTRLEGLSEEDRKKEKEKDAKALKDAKIPDYKIVFLDLVLRVDKIEMDKATFNHHQKSFNGGTLAFFPFCRSVTKSRQIPAGESYVKLDNVFINELPNNIILCMVKSTAYNGSIRENPFYFNHYNINYLAYKVNSEVIPPGGLKPDFSEELQSKNPLIMREYRRLFDHTGIGMGNITNHITPSLFKGGLTFFPHDFTPDRCLAFHTHKKISGNMDVELRFAQPLPHGVTILAIGSFDDYIELDSARNVVFRSTPNV